MKQIRITVCVFSALLALLPAANAQSVAGQISGTVVDAGGSSVPAAEVQLTNDLSKQVRAYTTEGNGTFSFPGLVNGNYSIHISKAGFKAYDSKGISVATQENVSLHEIQLTVGDVSTSVTVESNVARVQTDSSDRIATISTSTIEDVPSSNRSFLAATRTIVGSQSTSNTGGGTINGGQTGQLVLQLDGVTQQDSGAPSNNATGGRLLVNLDAVGEIQVQTNTMNAEFGSRAGGQITVTTKNGTNQYHGTAYLYLRNEDFNANSFFNNKTAVLRPRSRFQNPGFTVGGPVILPKLRFNRDRTKMYFFYAEDELYNKNSAVQSFTMPTAAEKSGDYSQTVNSKGALLPITDPTTGKQFAGNIIPGNRIDQEGLAMLNLFPTPGGGATAGGITAPLILDPTGNHGYNTQFSFVTRAPQTTRTLRVDYNIGTKTTMYVRLLQSLNNSIGVGSGQFLGGTSWGMLTNTNPQNGRGYVVTMVHTFRPNLIGEFTVGTNFIHQQNQPDDPIAYQKEGDLGNFKLANGNLVNPIQVFTGNFQNLIPNILFSGNKQQNAGQGITGAAPAFGYDSRWPFDGTDLATNYASNFTWIKGSHTIKSGFSMEHIARNVSVYSVFNTNGTYYFGTDTGNPLDTGYAYSNVLLGSIQSYGQDNVKQVNHTRGYLYEWYLQDTWKVSRKLTFDYGMRFQILPQLYSAGATLGLFNGASYSASKVGQLLFPSCKVAVTASTPCSVANSQAINPKTGKTYGGGQVGLFDPASYAAGSFPYSGIDIYQGKIFDTQHPQYGPRAGFAYDVTGDGKMAIRGGFGIFYQRAYSVDTIASNGAGVGPIKVPPSFQAPQYFNTTFSQLATALAYFGPQGFNGGSTTMPNPTTYNWSLSVQKDLGKGLIIDVAYVGNVAHHQQKLSYNANGIAPGTVWSPTQSGVNSAGLPLGTLNPTYANPNNPTQPLPINLLRSLIGYAGASDLQSFTADGESNYNALQVQVNRRFGKRFNFSSNYTWQKTQIYNRNQYLPDQLTKTVANRKHAVNVNLNYTLPTPAVLGKNFLTKAIAQGWHIDSVLSFFSGNPLTVGCAVPSNSPAGYPNGQDGVTSGLPFRCAMGSGTTFIDAATAAGALAANGFSATTDPRLLYPINIPNFTLPALNTYGFGNTPSAIFWGPGFENVDVSFYKQFQIRKETNQLRFQVDMLNALNHFNPGDPNTSISYNYANGQQTNASLGQITGAANGNRTVVLSMRFKF